MGPRARPHDGIKERGALVLLEGVALDEVRLQLWEGREVSLVVGLPTPLRAEPPA